MATWELHRLWYLSCFHHRDHLDTKINLARFFDSRNSPSASYQARIDWGDGNQTDGVVERTNTGNFQISGKHSFQSSGSKIGSAVIGTALAADGN